MFISYIFIVHSLRFSDITWIVLQFFFCQRLCYSVSSYIFFVEVVVCHLFFNVIFRLIFSGAFILGPPYVKILDLSLLPATAPKHN